MARRVQALALASILVGIAIAAWGQEKSPNRMADRFNLVMENSAVLDKETGLVWEQSPNTGTFTWLNAQMHCNQKTVGGRKGWRLPTIQELASLVDPKSIGGGSFLPAGDLPAGHPFSNVQSSQYWSATTDTRGPGFARVMNFSSGVVLLTGIMANDHFVWCVRSGQGVDPQ